MPNELTYEAVKLLARATFERDKGNLQRALELLDEVIALGDQDESFKREHLYVIAHIYLYKVHRALGHREEALDYYLRAIALGATVEQLTSED